MLVIITWRSKTIQSGKYIHDYKVYANGKLVYTSNSAFGSNEGISFGPDYYFMYVVNPGHFPGAQLYRLNDL